MSKRSIILTLIFSLILPSLAGGNFDLGIEKAKAAVDRNNLCSDSAFVHSSALDANGIQNFLRSKGSFLANYSEGGRSAAQIIYNAARSNGVNPYVILAMIQKEEGLITGTHSKALNQTRLDWAMGYGYTDSEILDDYKGFTKQIDYGTWQLKRNYDYWASNGSKWNVGKTMVVDGVTVRFSNRCTSAQYRYTPHLGTNFSNYFSSWYSGTGVVAGSYDAQLVGQGPRSGYGAPGVTLPANKRFVVWVNYRNTGGTTWYKAGANAVRIGTSDPQDRGSVFAGGRNIRGALVQTAVKQGAIGTFQIWLTAPAESGTYTEKFRPVVENVKWIGEESVWTFTVAGRGGAATVSTNPQNTSSGTTTGVASADNYNAALVVQGPRIGVGMNESTVSRNQTFQVWVNYRNTGNKTWYKTGVNAVHLGTTDPNDRSSVFFGGANRRGYLVQNAVAPGAIGTFVFNVTAPKEPGKYTEKFRPVVENIAWVGDTVSWTWTVK